jgi:DNA invertase Pin-like site-specific DNA recombinase
VTEVVEDVDISAYQTKAKRPAFERLLVSIRNGDVDGVVVWKLDRLSRQQPDLVRVMKCANRGAASSRP